MPCDPVLREAHDCHEQRALSAAIGPEQRGRLAVVQFEVDAVEYLRISNLDYEITHLENHIVHGHLRSRDKSYPFPSIVHFSLTVYHPAGSVRNSYASSNARW
jgi:hypothetical protein